MLCRQGIPNTRLRHRHFAEHYTHRKIIEESVDKESCMKPPPYDKFARFYNLEYGHKDNDLDFYLSCAEEYGSPILEIGVGTGRVAFELAAAGYSVVGIDNSARMLKVAQQNLAQIDSHAAERLSLLQDDMRFFNLHRSFPLCIIPFRAFLHNLTTEDQLATLNRILEHLLPDGLLVFDLFVPLYHVIAGDEWHDRVEPEELADENSGIAIDIHVRHRPAQQLLKIRNSYTDQQSLKTTHADMTYRYVFKFEMEALLRSTGFKVVQVFGDFNRKPYIYHSGIMIFVAQRL
jgi:SAM-dependent methyltransferase